MAQRRLRVALDANVLIAGLLVPRWPYEVMQSMLLGHFEFVVPEPILVEVRRHLAATQLGALEEFLKLASPDDVPPPDTELVKENLDLVRSERDVPIALCLLAGGVDVLVSTDRDFTDEGATAKRLADRVRIMLPAVFLRDVVGWTSDELEAIRSRTWADMPGE